MITNKKLKLLALLGVTAAVALSAVSAEARGRNVYSDRGAYAADRYVYPQSGPFAYQPAPYSDVYQPSFRNSYGYFDDGTGYSGSGTFSDGREVPGTNWNPNQN